MDEKYLMGIAYKLLPRFPRQVQIEDLLQEGRIALWKARDKIPTEPQHAKRFCSLVVKNAMTDWVRYLWPARGNAGRIITYSVDDNPESTIEATDPITPLDHAQIQQTISRLEERISQHKQKAVAELRLKILTLLIEGHEGKDIAKTLGIAAETVSLHKTALRKIIKEFL